VSEKMKIEPTSVSLRSTFDVVKASGENILTYLQGQITQDVKLLSPHQALYAVILNPQSKAVTDFYLILTQQKENWAEVMFLCPSEQTAVFLQRLQMYALGFDLRMGKVSSWQVVSMQGKNVDAYLKASGLPLPATTPLAIAQDENTFAMRMIESDHDGVWLMGADLKLENNVDESVMEQGRIICGRPRFGVDWNQKLHPLNANLMERGGVSFDKGCYVGQEVTSRMQWRGGIKKKLYRVQLESLVESLPCPVLTTTKIGEITSLAKGDSGGFRGIALLPIEVVESEQKLATDEGLTVNVLGACDV